MAAHIADRLRAAAREHPDAVALISDDGSWTWVDLDRAADRGAVRLRGLRLAVGAPLLIQLPSGAALAAALFAAARADLILVPIDPTRTDVDEIAGRIGAAAVITGRSGVTGVPVVAADEVRGWLRPADDDDRLPIEPTGGGEAGGGEATVWLARASRGGSAVMLSHRSLLAATDMVLAAERLQLRREDRVLLALPMFHLAGFVTVFLPAAARGATVVLVEPAPPGSATPEEVLAYAERVLDTVHRHRVSILPGAPQLFRRLLRSARLERSLSTVRLLTSAASPLSVDDAIAIRARTGSPIWEGYGISEAASVVSTTLMSTQPTTASVGLPLPGVELRIELSDDQIALDVDDETVVDIETGNDPGRISLRGQNLFSGYWPDGIGGPDSDGWFTTDDVGYLDQKGRLHLMERAAETLRVAGFVVFPREVETALMTHPRLRDAAVVGLPGDAGTALVAAVVAFPGPDPLPTDDELTAHLAPTLPAFKHPVRYRWLDVLPRTELGRLDRDRLRRQWASDDGLDLMPRSGEPTRLAVVPVADEQPPPSDPPAKVEPEVIEVTELDQLGSRLPGVTARSRRSALEDDSDLFGEEVFGNPETDPPSSAGDQA